MYSEEIMGCMHRFIEKQAIWLTFIVTGLVSGIVLGGPLDDDTDRLIRHANIGPAKIGFSIIDLDTGEVLASHNPETAMIPASTMKLLTTGMALKVLGDDFTFRTEIAIDESYSPPVLILRGDGDPALGDPAIFVDEQPGVEIGTLFDQVAHTLQSAGVESVGGVVVDDRVFDRVFTHEAWPEDQLNRWYCAQVGGLNFHTNVINVYTQPAASGSPIIRMTPDAYWVQMQVKAKSNRKSRDTAWVSRPRRENSFTVHGNVSAQSEIPVAVDTPPLFAGRVIADALSSRGIQVGDSEQSSYESVKLWDIGDEYQTSRVLAVITTPIADVLKRVNTNSHNLYAEALLKRAGHAVTSDPGSWENGAAVLRMTIADKLGADAVETTVISDGSGMSRKNRVSADTFVSWIRSMSRTDEWDAFEDSLAIPGEGTLRRRFSDSLRSSLRAKSGYLTGTYALAGVLEHPMTRQRIGFSIMLNDVKVGSNSRNAKPFIDDLVEEMDAYLSDMAGESAMGG